jgi:hypothetical protein
MPKKHGQAALEFLMTYGWALLMIAILIGAIAYFGVLNPKDLISDRCTFNPEIECIDFSLNGEDNTLRLLLQNNVGELITLSSISLVSLDSKDLVCTIPSLPITWQFTQSKQLIFTDCNYDEAGYPIGKSAKISIDLTYYPVRSGTDFKKTAQGEIIGKIS